MHRGRLTSIARSVYLRYSQTCPRVVLIFQDSASLGDPSTRRSSYPSFSPNFPYILPLLTSHNTILPTLNPSCFTPSWIHFNTIYCSQHSFHKHLQDSYNYIIVIETRCAFQTAFSVLYAVTSSGKA